MTNDLDMRHPGRREALVAVAVACLLLGIAWLAGHVGSGSGNHTKDVARLSTMDSADPDGQVDVDLSASVTQTDVDACSTPAFGDPSQLTVLYGMEQRTSTGSPAVLVLQNADGDLRLCDSFGGTSPSTAPVTFADASEPVRFLSNGNQAWDCDSTVLQGFTMSQWLSVSDAVERVETRFLVNGVGGPWFRTQAQNGVVHPHAWLGEQREGAELQVQSRVLDAAGTPVSQEALPVGPQPLTGCTGGDVQIG